MRKKELPADSISKAFGVISLIFLSIEIFGLYVIFTRPITNTGYGGLGILDVAVLFVLAYIINKTLLRHVALSKTEKIVFVFIAILMLISFAVGVYIGFINAIKGGNAVPYNPAGQDGVPISAIAKTLLENKSITVPSQSYYVYPINLSENQTARFVLNVVGYGVFNTVMLNSGNYSLLTKSQFSGTVYYFTDTYESGVKSADVSVEVPYGNTFYFLISTMPILQGQATYDNPVDLNMLVYIS